MTAMTVRMIVGGKAQNKLRTFCCFIPLVQLLNQWKYVETDNEHNVPGRF